MMLFGDFFAAATAASAVIMFVRVAFVIMVMTATAAVIMRVAFVTVVMAASAAVIVGVTFVIMVMTATAAVIMGVAFMAFVMAAFAAMFMRVAFVIVSATAAVFMRMAFVIMVMTATAAVIVGVAFMAFVMAATAALGFFVFLVAGMLFAVMEGFLLLMAVAASAMMYMLFVVLFHSMSPYLEWKGSFLSGIILCCYFSILQMHRKWSMRNTLIIQVGVGEAEGLDRAKKE